MPDGAAHPVGAVPQPDPVAERLRAAQRQTVRVSEEQVESSCAVFCAGAGVDAGRLEAGVAEELGDDDEVRAGESEHDFRGPTEACTAPEQPAYGTRRPHSSWRSSSQDDESWQKLPFCAAHNVDEILIVDPAERTVALRRSTRAPGRPYFAPPDSFVTGTPCTWSSCRGLGGSAARARSCAGTWGSSLASLGAIARSPGRSGPGAASRRRAALTSAHCAEVAGW